MHADQLSKNISHPTTLGTIHIRHVNSVARRGVLKAGVDCTYLKYSTVPVVESPYLL
jgi:hypothetical protein